MDAENRCSLLPRRKRQARELAAEIRNFLAGMDQKLTSKIKVLKAEHAQKVKRYNSEVETLVDKLMPQFDSWLEKVNELGISFVDQPGYRESYRKRLEQWIRDGLKDEIKIWYYWRMEK